MLACLGRLHSECRFGTGIMVLVAWVINFLSFHLLPSLRVVKFFPPPCFLAPSVVLISNHFSCYVCFRVKNAEVLCLGLVSVTVFMLVMPLFKAAGGVLLQMAPPSIPSSALSKCLRQITACEDVSEVSDARFWELVPGHTVGSISLQVKGGVDDRQVLEFVHGLYHDLGVLDLTVQTEQE
ncbi:unnamed protein product [Linum tenue]|uniref:Uncharacterized protein n=1 Tax=Linum tenue TaxID=586396 RepID=A0AAV0IYT9_9ROSI|nr:unnamed protein product [Linum tenue]